MAGLHDLLTGAQDAVAGGRWGSALSALGYAKKKGLKDGAGRDVSIYINKAIASAEAKDGIMAHHAIQSAQDLLRSSGKVAPGGFDKESIRGSESLRGAIKAEVRRLMEQYTTSLSGQYKLSRDGKEIMTGTESEVWAYMHKTVSSSIQHAIKYEGYKIEPVGGQESVRESFKIMMYGSPQYGAEEIDTADDQEEANFLYGEYLLVYRNGLRAGDTWLWVEDNWGKVIAGKARESVAELDDGKRLQYIVKKDGKQVFKGDYGAATKYIYDATGGPGGKGTKDDALTKLGFQLIPTGQRESVRAREQAGSFEDWMEKVDRELIRIAGIGYMDIRDQLWHDWYDGGTSPKDAAEDALRDEGFPFQ